MRPVDKGEAPQVYRRYRDAIEDLESRLGLYCSYCERRLPCGLAVEHVSPKCLDPAHETDWNNFLLSCCNCNSVKGKKPTNNTDFIWPDRDNTLLALRYVEGGLVELGLDLSVEAKEKARSLIALVGLDRYPGHPTGNEPADRDRRYMQREELWSLAVFMKDLLSRNDTTDFRTTLVTLALAEGFFGVWMSVFHDDLDMRRRLVEEFQGTALECFDHEYKCVPRAGGHI